MAGEEDDGALEDAIGRQGVLGDQEGAGADLREGVAGVGADEADDGSAMAVEAEDSAEVVHVEGGEESDDDAQRDDP